MRVLSIGRPLANRAIDNHTIFNAPAAHDYDAVAIDPAGVFASIREAIDVSAPHLTHADVPVVNGEAGPGAPIAEILRNRRDEFTRVLERGGVIAVFTQPQAWIRDVTGFPGCDRYFFLPAPAGMAWDAELIRWGEGSSAVVSDHTHPFATFIDAVQQDVLYRAHFNDRAPGFAAAARVFARSHGGAPLGVEFPVLGGRVVFLPAPGQPSHEARRDQGRAIVDATRELLGHVDDDRPRWLDDETLPGFSELDAATRRAQEGLEDAKQALAEAERDAEHLTTVRDVLWRQGRFSFLPAVARCMELLGFRVSGLDEDEPRLWSDEGNLTLEAEGSDGAIGMAPHYRLRARLDALIERESKAPRGLIVVNGDRLRAPASRNAQFEDSLRVGAEATRYALLTATDLFAAVQAALAGANDATLASIRSRLVETDGVVSVADLLFKGSTSGALEEPAPAALEQTVEETASAAAE